MPAHRAFGMFSPHDAGSGVLQAVERPGTADFDAVVFGNGSYKLEVSGSLFVYLGIGALKNQRLRVCEIFNHDASPWCIY